MAYIGLHVPSFTFPDVQPAALFPRLVDIAAAAEASGFTALSVMDHFHQIAPQGSPDEPMLDAYATLAALAARTSRLELLTLVTGVVYHNPAQLAKQVTTLDVISGGRAILGIGAAWNEQEAVAYDFHFPPIGERMDRLEDALRICRAMFDAPLSTVQGRYHGVDGAYNVPQPLRRIPIMVGGGGERRTLRLVARHADLCNVIGSDVEMLKHKVDVLRRHCEAESRDAATIVKTAHVGIAVVEDDEASVQRRLEALAADPPPVLVGLDAGKLRRRLVCGTPDEFVERLRAIRAAGADGVTMSIRGVHDLHPIELAGRAAAEAFA
jgi:F420-dependent oxidoreductase-like protein